MSKSDLKDCFLRLQQGDKDAFARIYHELKQPVFTIASRIVRSKEMAEDITQDIFLKLYVSPINSSVKNPRAWVFKMTRNLAIDALRRGNCTQLDEADIPANDKIHDLIMHWDIETAIKQLSYQEREILSLHINGELSFLEVSKIVGLSLPATYRKYRKALHTLRNLLSGGAI